MVQSCHSSNVGPRGPHPTSTYSSPWLFLPIASYKLNRAWITKYTALPELDANSGGFGIQSVTLRHEGWERVI